MFREWYLFLEKCKVGDFSGGQAGFRALIVAKDDDNGRIFEMEEASPEFLALVVVKRDTVARRFWLFDTFTITDQAKALSRIKGLCGRGRGPYAPWQSVAKGETILCVVARTKVLEMKNWILDRSKEVFVD
jgi:hypothetical protein